MSRVRVDPASGCHIWAGAKTGDGYGARKVAGRVEYVHRLAYIEANGPIPEGFQVDHVCANEKGLTAEERIRRRACCNPDHLEAVPPAVNMQRSSRATLDAAAVAEIRASSELGTVIAPRFGVTPAAISKIRTEREWGSWRQAA